MSLAATSHSAPADRHWLVRKGKGLLRMAQRPQVRGALIAVFVAVVLGLLLRGAQNVDWPEVWQALRQTPTWRLAAAVALAALGYGVYASFDVLGRRFTGHTLPRRQVLAVSATSYAINQNLGYLLGGVGLRLRLYSALGLQPVVVAGVAGASALTNWLGHLAAFGVLLIVGDEPLPAAWGLGRSDWMARGVGALLVVAVYLLACAGSRRRELNWAGLTLTLPRLRLAALQVLLGAASWLLMAAVLWVALPEGARFAAVAAAVMVAAVAGAISHVPAGLGVLEAVLVTLLSPGWPAHEVLAGALVYRAAYQWLPGLLAGLGVLVFEHGQRRR